MRMRVASSLLSLVLAALGLASAVHDVVSPQPLSAVAAPGAWDALVTALSSRLPQCLSVDDEDGSCVAWDPIDEADAPLLRLSLSSQAFVVTQRDHEWTPTGIYAASRVADDGKSELELVAPAMALRSAVEGISIQARGSGSAPAVIQRHCFRLRVDAAAHNASVRSYSLATTRPAMGSTGMVGTFQLGVRLVDGYYESIGVTIRGLECSSAMISPADPVAAIETQVREMPCVGTSPDSISPERQEIQVLSVEVATTESTLRDYTQELVIFNVEGRPSAILPIGVTDAVLVAQLRTLTADAALEISRVVDEDRRRQWQVTFSSLGAQRLIGAAVVDASIPIRALTSVFRRGLDASDLKLSLFYRSLSVDVQDSRRTGDLQSVAFRVSVWTSEEHVEPPAIALLQSTIRDRSSGEAMEVTCNLVPSAEIPSLFLVIDGRRSSMLSARSNEIASAIEATRESSIQTVTVNEDNASLDGPLPEWTIEITSTGSFDFQAIEGNSLTSVFLTQESQEVIGKALDGVVTTTLTDVFNSQRFYSGAIDLRVMAPVSPPRFADATAMPSLRVGSKLDLNGVDIQGDDVPVSLAIQPRVGVVVASTDSLGSETERNGLLWSRATPSLLNRVFTGTGGSVVYRVTPQSINCDFLPRVTSIDFQLKYTLNGTLEVVEWAMPVQILPEDDAPVALYVPIDDLRLAAYEEKSLVGVELKSDSRRRFSSTVTKHRMRITAKNGGQVFLHDAAKQFAGSSVRSTGGNSTIQVEGSIGLVNTALQGLRYRAPKHNGSDEIVLIHTSDGDTGEYVHLIHVDVSPSTKSVRINWNGNRLSLAGVIQSEEDVPISLTGLTLEYDDAFGSSSATADSAILNVTISSAHGSMRAYDKTTSKMVSGPDDTLTVVLIGNRSALNSAFTDVTYTPRSNYNGLDGIEISVVPDAGPSFVSPRKGVLHVFMKPVDDPIQVVWAHSQSAEGQIVLASCCASYKLPTLLLTDDDDRAGRNFQVSIEIPAASFVDLVHDSLSVSTKTTMEKREVRSLQFEGGLTDVRKTLAAVSILPSWRVLTVDDSIKLTVSITSRDIVTGRMVDAVNAALRIAIDRHAFRRTIPRHESFAEIEEDNDLPLSTIAALPAFVKVLGEDASIVLSCSHGVFSSASSDFSSAPVKNISFQPQASRSMSETLMRLTYTPDRDYFGFDELVVGSEDFKLSIHIIVRPVNDAPTLQFGGIQHENETLLRYMSTFRVSDADDDTVKVSMTVQEEDVFLVMKDPSIVRTAGLWVENLHEDQSAGLGTRQMLVHGRTSAINQVFDDPALVRLESRDHLLSNTTIRGCITDGQARFCSTQTISLPSIELIMTRVTASIVLSLVEGKAQRIRDLVSLNVTSSQRREIATMHVSATFGEFQKSFKSSVSRDDCRSAVMTKRSYGHQPAEQHVSFNGALRCIQQVLEDMDYVPLRATGTDERVNLIIALTVGGRSRREVFEIDVRQAEPAHLVRFTRHSASENGSDAAWKLSRVAWTPLRQFGDLEIVAKDAASTEDRFLSLNVSCSLSCVLGNDFKTGALIPHAVYVNDQAIPSREHRYYGTISALDDILQSLDIQLNVGQNVTEGTANVTVTLAPAHTEPSHRTKTVVAATAIPFSFVVETPSLKWRIRQSEFEGDERSVLRIDGMSIDALGHDPQRRVRVSVQCFPSAIFFLYSNAHPRAQSCDQQPPISLAAPLVEMNTALARMGIRRGVNVTGHRQIVMQLTLMTTDGDVESIEDSAQLSFRFRSLGPSRRHLQEVVGAIDTVITAAEGGNVALGDLFMAKEADMAELYQLRLSAERGTLSIPIGDICCVRIMGQPRGSQVRMEGTLSRLQLAVSRVQYQPSEGFFGRDQVMLTIESDGAATEQPLVRQILRVRVDAVNQPPRIKIRAIGTNAVVSDGIARTELSILVDDVDVGRLASVLHQLNMTQKQTSELLCTLHATSGRIVVPRWSQVQTLAADVGSTHALDGDALTATELNFSAPLATINSVLKAIILAHNLTSCADPTISDEEPTLTVTINDRANGLAHVWEPLQATEAFNVCDNLGRILDASSLSIKLPSEAAHVDTSSRKLLISRVTLNSKSPLNGEETTTRVTGAVAIRVTPEVQRVQLVGPQHVQVITLTLASVGSPVTSVIGSFELISTGPAPRSTMVYPQAVAMKIEELDGDVGAGRGPGESMEARLGLVYGESELKKRRIHIELTPKDGGFAAEWKVFVFLDPGVSPLPRLQIGVSTLVAPDGSSVSVVTTSSIVDGQVHGFFTLALGSTLVTRPIRAEADSQELQDALDDLTGVGVVARVANVRPFTWDITFMRPGFNLPLLKGGESTLSPGLQISDTASPMVRSAGTRVEVSRVAAGQGRGSLFQIDVNATAVEPVYRIEAPRTIASARMGGGWFRLGFRTNEQPQMMAETKDIAWDAVAMESDEGVLMEEGGRIGGSIESALRQVLEAMAEATAQPWISAIGVLVNRSASGAPTWYTWTVTFSNTPVDFPELVVATFSPSTLSAVTVTPVRLANAVSGYFTLSVAGATTAPLAVSASDLDVETALNGLVTVRDPVTGVGGVIVRRLELPLVGGTSFALLFIEETASSVGPHRVSADGALLKGLGAFVRVKRLEAAAMDGQWHSLAFGAALKQVGASFWVGDVRAELSAGSFELRGPVSQVGALLSGISFLFSSDGSCGLISVVLRIHDVDSSAVVDSARSDPQTLPCKASHHVDVVATELQDLSVERGAVEIIPSIRLTAPAWTHTQLWVRVQVRTRDGQLRARSVPSQEQSQELSLNGTVAMVNAQLGGLSYFTDLATNFSIDFLSLDIFADASGDRLGQAQFLIRISEPPLEPTLRVRMASQPGADGDIDGVVYMQEDEPLVVTALQVVPQRGRAGQAEEMELAVHVELGQLDFAFVDRVVVLRSNHESSLVLRGALHALNEALQTLRYEPSHVFRHERDTLTARLTYQPPKRPLITDVKRLRISIRQVVHLPKVVVHTNQTTRAVAFSSKEDNGFQFPGLVLAHETRLQLPSSRRRRRGVTELRRTDLGAPLVTTSGLDDWRHQWVADFPALRVPFGSAFAAAGASSFVFSGSDLRHGEELWVSDGTTGGTRLLVDLMPGNGSSRPSDFAAVPGRIGKVLLAADGVDISWALQTQRRCNQARVSSAAPNIQFLVAASSVWDPTASYDCPRGWRWATTSEGRSVFNSPIATLNHSEPFVFWSACDWQGYTFGGVSRKHFRFADSRVTGATKHAGRRDSAPVEVSFVTTDFAGIVCIRDEALESASGRELWVVDVPSQSAARVLDLETGPRGSAPRFLTPYLTQWVLFQATTSEHGAELYKTDGRASGTVLVEDIWRGPRSSNPSDFGEWASAAGGDGRMYFAATTDAGRELWSTDGSSSLTSDRQRRTAAGLRIGTVLVRDLCPGPGSSEPKFMTALGAVGVFFAASDCVHGRELWVTDGTGTGTKMVRDINPTPGEGSEPTDLVAFNGKLYFAATSDSVAMGRELFVSDGTSLGTTLLMELAPGVASSSPASFSVANSQLFFHARDSRGLASLWSTDGAVAGTSAVWDSVFAQQYQFIGPQRLWVQSNALFFFVERSSGVDEAIERAVIPPDEDEAFNLVVSVGSGSISVPGTKNSIPLPSLALVGSVRRLRSLLSRLLFHPSLNWNSHQLPLGDHVVQWQFLVSSPLLPGLTSSTAVDLLVRPQSDPPVIIVPLSVADPIRFSSDYLSRLRSVCLPISVLEDVPTPLTGFAVRAIDDRDAQDEIGTWTMDVEVAVGRIDVRDTRGCLKTLELGRLQATQRLRVSAFRIKCLSQLLETLRYTSAPDTSGADTLKIRVTRTASAQPTQDHVVVPVVVLQVNDAPSVTSASGFYYEATEDQARVIQDLVIVDPDSVGSISVEVRTLHGQVQVLNAGTTLTSPGKSPETPLVITGALHDVNAALAGLVYTSAKDWNSLLDMDASDGLDQLTISVTDGQQFNASTRATVFVYVHPAADPLVITSPTVMPTSVFASANDSILHGDEDEWLPIDSLSFATVDEAGSRTGVDVTLRVGHGALDFGGSLGGVTTIGSSLDGSYWRLRGSMDDVNRVVSVLRYKPSLDFVGADSLEIAAGASDGFARSSSTETRLTTAIEVHGLNDPPQWHVPSTLIGWTQNAPTRIEGVALTDADCSSSSSLDCVLEVVVECTASAILTFPQLATAALDAAFSSSMDALQSSYVVLSGPLTSLNVALSEIVLTTKDQDTQVLEPAEIWLTADDRGNSGNGGPQISQARLMVTPLQWVTQKLSLVTPADAVLTTTEDTALTFASSTLRLEDRDATTRPPTASSPLYKVEVRSSHGAFRLSASPASASGILVLATTDNSVRFRGFLPQVNAVLNGSSYVPEPDWFGSDELIISARELTGSDHDAVLATIFIYVEPTCDEPSWNQTLGLDGADADIELDEDGQALLSGLVIVDPDDSGDGEGVGVTLSIVVLDGGGVMLATTRGLQLTEQKSAQWVSQPSLALLFLSQVQLTGRVASINAALRGLIYRSRPDFHSHGHVVDAIKLELSSASCTVSGQVVKRLKTVRAQVHAVPDPLQLDSTRFSRVTSRDIELDQLHYGEPSMETREGQKTPLEAITLVDPDTYDDESDTPPLQIRLRLSCRSCLVRPSADLDSLQRVHDILVSHTDPGNADSAWTPTWIFYGTLSELNDALLSSLEFVSAPQFHGRAVVLLRVSDVGFYGRGDLRESAFSMVVRVRSTNTPPQIITPPYGTSQPPLEADEHSSLLVAGAVPSQMRRPAPARYNRRVLQLMAVDPLASDSSGRLQSLLDVVETDAALPQLAFYTLLDPQRLLFSASTPTTGAELWSSDGTTHGTRMLRDISPGPQGSNPHFLTRFSIDGSVYFAAKGPNTDAWRTPEDYRDTCGGFRASSFAPGVFFLVAERAVWDPEAVYDCPSGFRWMTTAEAERVFIGTVATHGAATEPLVYYRQCGWDGYVWGGVERRHFRFADSRLTGAYKHAGHRDSYRVDLGFDTEAFAGIVCVSRGDRETEEETWSTEVWRSDGTTGGTHPVTAIGSRVVSADPKFLTEFRSRLFFQATSEALGSELWSSDGTRSGTRLVADMALGERSSAPEHLTVAAERLFFSATTELFGRELWVTDGEPRDDYAYVDHAATSTRLVLDIYAGPKSSNPSFMVALPSSGWLLFQADDGINGCELWRSDGTTMGTSLVLDIRAGAVGSSPQFLVQYNGAIYFQADDGIHGAELWVTDGTAANTKMLVDVTVGVRGSAPSYMTVLPFSSGPEIVFAAASDRDPRVTEFWRCDGSRTGTVRVFAGSREVATPFDASMRELHRPWLVPLGRGFVFIGEKPHKLQAASAVNRGLHSQSIVLEDDDADEDRNYTLTLQCEHGNLSLSRRPELCGKTVDGHSTTPAATLSLRGRLSDLNCAVAEVVYHAATQSDAIVVTLTEEQLTNSRDGEEGGDGRAYAATQHMRVRVLSRNHPPVVQAPSRLFAQLGHWTRLTAIHVSDEDAGDAWLLLRMTASVGRLRLVETSSMDVTVLNETPNAEDPSRGSGVVELSAPISQIAVLLSGHVEYACLVLDGCEHGSLDTVTVTVDDNGFTGSGGPQSATRMVEMAVLQA